MNMPNTLFRTLIAISIALSFASYAPTAMARTLPELRERFKSRYADIQQFKTAGKIGETFRGYLAAVRPEYASDAKVKSLLDEENADRQELYAAMAKQTNTTAEEVATRNAAREFEKAKPGEWLQYADGGWKQKQ